jgi:hypothetical protein
MRAISLKKLIARLPPSMRGLRARRRERSAPLPTWHPPPLSFDDSICRFERRMR